MDNPVMSVSSRASNLNVLLAKNGLKYAFRLPLWFRRLKHNKSNTQTILLFTKQLLLVFNVGKIRLHVAY
jgi:hypothetical protein